MHWNHWNSLHTEQKWSRNSHLKLECLYIHFNSVHHQNKISWKRNSTVAIGNRERANSHWTDMFTSKVASFDTGQSVQGIKPYRVCSRVCCPLALQGSGVAIRRGSCSIGSSCWIRCVICFSTCQCGTSDMLATICSCHFLTFWYFGFDIWAAGKKMRHNE